MDFCFIVSVTILEFSVFILAFASVAGPWKLATVLTVMPKLEGNNTDRCQAFKPLGML